MRPQWFQLESIPFDKMWPDDKFWFPIFLKGKHFYGYFNFSGHDIITDYTLKEVADIKMINIPKGSDT